MVKIRYLLVAAIVLTGAMILIPNSPVYRLAGAYTLKKMEARWDCAVVRNRIHVNPITGRLILSDLLIETSQTANPKWRLEIKTAALKIGYLSFLRNRAIDSLLFDNMVYIQETRAPATAGVPGRQHARVKASKKKTSGTPRDSHGMGPEKIHIKRLSIRNGSFEYILIDASGVKNRVQADQISIDRKNIRLDKRPDEFFQSLLGTQTRF